jgi:uncharacterized protein YnzC (UPF0291/DUF896 family)
MITREMIERINALSRKQRSVGLTEEEKNEQALLRRTYIDNIKGQVRSHLESIHSDSTCSCGCQSGHKH